MIVLSQQSTTDSMINYYLLHVLIIKFIIVDDGSIVLYRATSVSSVPQIS